MVSSRVLLESLFPYLHHLLDSRTGHEALMPRMIVGDFGLGIKFLVLREDSQDEGVPRDERYCTSVSASCENRSLRRWRGNVDVCTYQDRLPLPCLPPGIHGPQELGSIPLGHALPHSHSEDVHSPTSPGGTW